MKKLTTEERVYFNNGEMSDIAHHAIERLVGCAVDQYDINALDDATRKNVEALERIMELSELNHDYLFENKK